MSLRLANPYRRLVAVHWGGEDRPPGAVGIFSATKGSDSLHQSPAGTYWPFMARLIVPGDNRAAARAAAESVDLSEAAGWFVVGSYVNQSGLGGVYAHAFDHRLDPHVGGAGDPHSFLLPGDISDDLFSDCYLWHCGDPSTTGWAWQSVIVNLAKLNDIYGNSDGPPLVMLEAAGLAFPLSWEFRVYGAPGTGDTGAFSVDDTGRVSYGAELVNSQSGTGVPSIVTGLRVQYPPAV